MLSTLFSEKMDTEEKKHVLAESYSFILTEEAGMEVAEMCNISGAIAWEKDYEIADLKGLLAQRDEELAQRGEELAMQEKRYTEELSRRQRQIEELERQLAQMQH